MPLDHRRSASFSSRFRARETSSPAPDVPPVPVIPAYLRDADSSDNKMSESSRKPSLRDLWNTSVVQRVHRSKRSSKSHKSTPSKDSIRILSISTPEHKHVPFHHESLTPSPEMPRPNRTFGDWDLNPLGAHPPPSPSVRPTSRHLSGRSQLAPSELERMFCGAPRFTSGGSNGRDVTIKYRGMDSKTQSELHDDDRAAHSSFALATMAGLDTNITRDLQGFDHRPHSTAGTGLVAVDHAAYIESVQATQGSDVVYSHDHSKKLGLRHVSLDTLLARFSELQGIEEVASFDSVRRKRPVNEQQVADLYQGLFNTLPMPSTNDALSGTSIMDLSAQSAYIIRVLEQGNVWFDFTHETNRQRFGRLLPIQLGEPNEDDRCSAEQRIFLLQMVLSMELILRLGLRSNPPHVDVHPELSNKVKWDIIAAQRLLQAVELIPKALQTSAAKAANRQSVFSILSFVTARESFAAPDEPESAALVFKSRIQDVQAAGLEYFRQTLGWPADDFVMMEHEVDDESNPIDPWMMGLILPGRSASIELMNSLVRTASDPSLTEKSLTSNSLLINKSRAYFTAGSLLGRAMSAAPDAAQCMGWTSVPVFSPAETCMIEFPSSSENTSSTMTHLTDLSSHTPNPNSSATDYTWPTDGHPIFGNELSSYTLTLSKFPVQAELTFNPPPSRLLPLTLTLTQAAYFPLSTPCYPLQRPPPSAPSARPFSSAEDKDLPPPPSHPLHRSQAYTLIPALAILADDERLTPFIRRGSPLAEHPTRKRQDSATRSPRSSPSTDEPRDPTEQSPPTPGSGRGTYYTHDAGAGGRVAGQTRSTLVLDCRGDAKLHLLARAWCASVGLQALVAPVQRTCLACSVREARAAGQVLLRV